MKFRLRFRKKPKLVVNKFLNSLLLIFVGALFITTVLIALPLTEKISDKVSFNLNSKEKQYWSKEYVLSVGTTEKKELQKVKQIIFKRLRNFGVERVTIFNEAVSDTDSELRVIINSTKDQGLVHQLLTTQHSFTIVTRKADANFDDPENPYAIIMKDNYEETEWNYEDFRTVYIPKNKLRTDGGDYQYFAIFKPWPNKQNALTKFLTQHKSELLGVEIDSFVQPFRVQEIQEGNTAQQTITVGINEETEDGAKATSLLFNSGHIKPSLSPKEEKVVDPDIISLDYVKVSIALTISLLTAYIYMAIFKYSSNKQLLQSFFTTVLTLSLYLAYLKLTFIPVDTFLLAIQFMLMMIFIKAVADNQDAELFLTTTSILVFIVIALLGSGFMPLFAQGMIALIALSKVSSLLTIWYLDNVKEI